MRYKLFAPLFILVPSLSLLIAEDSSLSSKNATYDGNQLSLTGHVLLDHGLGQLRAEKAFLQRQETGGDFPFSWIQLKEDVEIHLQNGAKIHCGDADLDFQALKGTLLPMPDAQVSYSDPLEKNPKQTPALLHLTGNQVHLQFLKHLNVSEKSQYDIETVTVEEKVKIDYAGEFQLFSDHAIYQKGIDPSLKGQLTGRLTAYPKESSSFCRLVHLQDQIDADKIDLDLTEKQAHLFQPKGKIATSFFSSEEKDPTLFYAKMLTWDQQKNTLLLQGDVCVEEKSLGMLSVQDKIEIIQSIQDGKNQITLVKTQGPSSLYYKDEKQISHQLISKGPITIDRSHLMATIESPKQEGIILPEQQIYYEEEELAVFADYAQLEYALIGNMVQPIALALKGNIRLFSKEGSSSLRYGLSDRLTYSLATRTLILYADPGKKVLFFDEAQGMRLSSPEVHITQDPETKQQQIKGVGKVQFAFTQEEQSKLQHFFPELKR